MRLVLVAALGVALLSACNDPAGAWCGTYWDRSYPKLTGQPFVSYFQFCDSGDVFIQLTGRRTNNPSGYDQPGEWGKWEKTTEGHAFTTHPPQYPKFSYKLLGHWHQDGGEADYTVWDRLYPKYTDGKARGTAERCEERYACVPVYSDFKPPDMRPHDGIREGPHHHSQ